MNIRYLRCPNCDKYVGLSAVKSEFLCPHCRTKLKSNIIFAIIFMVVGWSVFVPFVTNAIAPYLCGRGGVCYGVIEGLLGALAFVFVGLLLLRIRKHDEPTDEQSP